MRRGITRTIRGGKKKESILAKGREGDIGEARKQGCKGTLPRVMFVLSPSDIRHAASYLSN